MQYNFKTRINAAATLVQASHDYKAQHDSAVNFCSVVLDVMDSKPQELAERLMHAHKLTDLDSAYGIITAALRDLRSSLDGGLYGEKAKHNYGHNVSLDKVLNDAVKIYRKEVGNEMLMRHEIQPAAIRAGRQFIGASFRAYLAIGRKINYNFFHEAQTALGKDLDRLMHLMSTLEDDLTSGATTIYGAGTVGTHSENGKDLIFIDNHNYTGYVPLGDGECLKVAKNYKAYVSDPNALAHSHSGAIGRLVWFAAVKLYKGEV